MSRGRFSYPESSPAVAVAPARTNPHAVTRRHVTHISTAQGLTESMRQARLNYRAAQPSKFRTTLTKLGGTADAHATTLEYWQIREYVRDWDRNTPIIGQLVDRGIDQILESGLRTDPQTGDEAVNAVALDLWETWANDKNTCDFAKRLTFDEMEALALRHRWIDGDAFAILNDRDGTIRMEEGDRVTSSGAQYTIRVDGQIRDLVHGVELDPVSTAPLAYYFLKLAPGDRQRRRRINPVVQSDMVVRIEAKHVIHIHQPKRFSETRSFSAFHAVFDRVPMLDDLEFALLVQQEVAACVSVFITSDYNQQWGPRSTETGADNSTLITFDELQPGMMPRLRPGEKIETFSPNNPTSDAREQAKQIVREIGLAIGMPLELTMLITSDTTFHGYRGVIEAYKKTARKLQKRYSRQFRSRVYRWKIAQWVEQGLLPGMPTIDRHQVHYPSWQYVDPETDAKADSLRIKDFLASSRQVWAERGRSYDEGVKEIVEDRSRLIKAADDEASAIGVEDVTWRDILGIEQPPAPPEDKTDPGKGTQ